MNFDFKNKTESEKDKILGDYYFYGKEKAALGIAISVVDGKVKDKGDKTWLQLKGLHKLCSLLAKRLTELNGLPYDLECAKDFVKWQFDFTTKASEEECLAECLNEKARRKTMGLEMKKEEFVKLFEAFKLSLKAKKSFADATKEEMIVLIEKIHELAKKMDWKEVRLENEEIKAMIDFYDKK
jgi:hypothetical protein